MPPLRQNPAKLIPRTPEDQFFSLAYPHINLSTILYQISDISKEFNTLIPPLIPHTFLCSMGGTILIFLRAII